MTKKNIQVALQGSERATALQAQEGRRFNDIVFSGMSWGLQCRGLGEEDNDVVGSRTVRVDSIVHSGRMRTLWAREWRGSMTSWARGG
jgi:hypothetical protein